MAEINENTTQIENTEVDTSVKSESMIRENQSATSDNINNVNGDIHISEDVVAQVVVSAMHMIPGVSAATPGLMANLRLGRKTFNGVRVSFAEENEENIIVDLYVTVRYGLRIPDVCWDVQEAVKNKVEQLTGYSVKNVNVYVQGIDLPTDKDKTETAAVEQVKENNADNSVE